MSNHSHDSHASHADHSAHGGHEAEDFKGTYAIWAVPFSIAVLMVFVFIVVLWVPSAVGNELKSKDLEGAEIGAQSLIEHRAAESEELASMAVERSMADLADQAANSNNSSSTPE